MARRIARIQRSYRPYRPGGRPKIASQSCSRLVGLSKTIVPPAADTRSMVTTSRVFRRMAIQPNGGSSGICSKLSGSLGGDDSSGISECGGTNRGSMPGGPLERRSRTVIIPSGNGPAAKRSSSPCASITRAPPTRSPTMRPGAPPIAVSVAGGTSWAGLSGGCSTLTGKVALKGSRQMCPSCSGLAARLRTTPTSSAFMTAVTTY